MVMVVVLIVLVVVLVDGVDVVVLMVVLVLVGVSGGWMLGGGGIPFLQNKIPPVTRGFFTMGIYAVYLTLMYI